MHLLGVNLPIYSFKEEKLKDRQVQGVKYNNLTKNIDKMSKH